IWFHPGRFRLQAIRVGQFRNTIYESAPVQLVPVSNPEAAEIGAGLIVEGGRGQFLRRQQVVYTGVFLNGARRLNVAPPKFATDLYVWMRYASVGTSDPSEIIFPDLIRGSSEGMRLIGEGDIDDGTRYRLWRMRGEFKNDFDLHHYPVDRQTLQVRFFNAH